MKKKWRNSPEQERSDREEEVPSAALTTSVQLANAEQRSAFVEEYVQLVDQLVKKYQTSANGEETYQVVLAVYPKEGGEEA